MLLHIIGTEITGLQSEERREKQSRILGDKRENDSCTSTFSTGWCWDTSLFSLGYQRYKSFPIINICLFESESCSVLFYSLQLHGLHSPWNSSGQNTGVGSLSFLQGIFPTQRSNPGFPQCRQTLYQLSHQGCPRILEWVAYPFSRWPTWLRNQTSVSCIAGGFFINWAMKEAIFLKSVLMHGCHLKTKRFYRINCTYLQDGYI